MTSCLSVLASWPGTQLVSDLLTVDLPRSTNLVVPPGLPCPVTLAPRAAVDQLAGAPGLINAPIRIYWGAGAWIRVGAQPVEVPPGRYYAIPPLLPGHSRAHIMEPIVYPGEVLNLAPDVTMGVMVLALRTGITSADPSRANWVKQIECDIDLIPQGAADTERICAGYSLLPGDFHLWTTLLSIADDVSELVKYTPLDSGQFGSLLDFGPIPVGNGVGGVLGLMFPFFSNGLAELFLAWDPAAAGNVAYTGASIIKSSNMAIGGGA